MIKSIYSTIFVNFLIYTNILLGQTFYVSPTGNDTNSGTMGAPLQSFKGSVEAIKNAGGSGTVYFREGSYVFDETVIINKNNCGGGATFSAYGNEKVTFTSLIQVTGWTTY